MTSQSNLAAEKPTRVISEERHELAKEGEFGTTVLTNNEEGTLETKTITICDSCFRKLDIDKEEFSVCKKCKHKLCNRCSIEFQGEIICKDDLQEIRPMSREQFKVFLMVTKGIEKSKTIWQATGIPRKKVIEVFRSLVDAEYLDKHGFFGYCETSLGLETFYAYKQRYRGDTEIVLLDVEAGEFAGQPS